MLVRYYKLTSLQHYVIISYASYFNTHIEIAEKITRGEMHMKSTWKTAAIIAAILIPAFSFGITANALSFAGTQHSFVFEVSAETLVYGDFEYTLVGDDVTLTKFI